MFLEETNPVLSHDVSFWARLEASDGMMLVRCAYMEEHPGPPFNQRVRGAVVASERASKNQYHMCMALVAEVRSASR